MRPRRLQQYLDHALTTAAAGKRVRPILIRGRPGVGKTSLVYQVCEAHGLKPGDGLEMLDLIVRDPTDIGGLPAIDGGKAVWLPPDWSERAMRRPFGVLLIDDLGAAAPQVQAAAFRLILEGESGASKVPRDWVRIACTNSADDKTVHWKMPSPLANRFVHLGLEYDLEDFRSWGLGAGIDQRILAFLQHMGGGQYLYSGPLQDVAFASPRCMGRGTLVTMADGTYRAIENVKPGEWVLGFDRKRGRFSPARVKATHRKRLRKRIIVNDNLVCSPEHHFLQASPERWVQAKSLKLPIYVAWDILADLKAKGLDSEGVQRVAPPCNNGDGTRACT